MKIGKKLLFVIIPVMLLVSSCGLFKGGQGGGRNCDCPKFGETPDDTEQVDDAVNS